MTIQSFYIHAINIGKDNHDIYGPFPLVSPDEPSIDITYTGIRAGEMGDQVFTWTDNDPGCSRIDPEGQTWHDGWKPTRYAWRIRHNDTWPGRVGHQENVNDHLYTDIWCVFSEDEPMDLQKDWDRKTDATVADEW